ncbi:glycosyltransferase 87 family protein [Microlunatus soli]|uniref:Alpha-1,2-mannosyltransferase n=1 Tax=Microlunatus soli TaxID=630515 RepID=A0A1H1Z3F1_9ACTN|nr:glycosyltransferase 87 family protein [Microlunatus soli]SDT28137.1 alpha-1,2-mannosyltransferase [Microlunatus soli]
MATVSTGRHPEAEQPSSEQTRPGGAGGRPGPRSHPSPSSPTTGADAPAGTRPRPGRSLLSGLLTCLLPCLASLFVAGKSWGAGLIPWKPRQADLEVYLRAGRALLSGADPYHLPDSLPFLYPPFAAILAVPMTWLPHGLVLAGWAIGIGLSTTAILHRLGLTGWRLSLVSAATVLVVEPVNQTTAFGQLGVFLVALVLLDLVAGPRAITVPARIRRGRWLPEGVLVGLATAIKLTPGLFFVYLLAIRRFRAAAVSIATMIICCGLALLAAPRTSIDFWSRLLHGDSGLGSSIVYLINQSILGASTRILGYNTVGNAIGLALAVIAAALGVIVGVVWHRRGDEMMAVVLCGVATLLASPVSWSHHFVWVMPLGYLLAVRTGWPDWFRVLGWLFVGWVVAAPYKFLPSGDDLELKYRWWQEIFGATTPVLGLAVLVAAWLVGRRRPAAPSADSVAEVGTDR